MTTKDGYYFDDRAADLAIAFFERFLRHSKGEWAGQPFVLEDWQKTDIIRPLFGWKRPDGFRKYRWAYIEVPKKNGKSTLAAGIALYLLFADAEPGAEIYGAASDREQAAIVFDIARAMVEQEPELDSRSETYRRSIVVPKSRSFYNVLSADAYSKHGFNAHGVIFDELHAQPNRELWDVLTTGIAARRQPLVVAITTAGYDKESICWEQHEYARQVLEGIIEDPTYFAYIRAAEEDDDWLDPDIWKKANPSLGVSVKLEYLESQAKKAENVPAYQNTFRRLHLDQWTSQDTRWLPMNDWDACERLIDIEDLEGMDCYAGLDLASTIDIAAFLLDFDLGEEWHMWQSFFWIPSENMLERARKDRVPYDAWTRDGLIKATEGNVIDYATIGADIEQLGERYHIKEIAFDRWGATQMVQQLEGAGFTPVQFGQGYKSMSAPSKELLRIVLGHKLVHNRNPVLRWMADNLVVSQDAAGNVKPNKEKSREKIDGIVAGIMALDRTVRHEGDEGDSIYDERGIVTL